jgi:cytochrome P450
MHILVRLPPSLILVLVTVLGVIAYISLKGYLARRQFARAHGCQPVAKSANKDPFFGLDTIPATIRALRENRIIARTPEFYRRFGNTHKVIGIVSKQITTIEPENIKTVLSLNFKDYRLGFRLPSFKPLLGEGIFDTDGDQWASSRALIRPSFTRDQVADLTILEDLIQDLFALLPRDGKTVDLQKLFFQYTIDSATEFLFGQSVGTLKKSQSESDRGFAEAFYNAQEAILTRGIPFPLKLFFSHDEAKAEKYNQICRKFVQQFVDKAFQAVELKKPETEKSDSDIKRPRHIFSHELAARTTDRTRVLDELMNVLLAGRDTTASLLSNLFFVLAKDPAIWAKLRREVAFLEGRPPTYSELNNMKYVQCCMNECKIAPSCLELLSAEYFKFASSCILNLGRPVLTLPALRLHPVVPRNNREAIRNTVLPLGGGQDGLSPVFVPKGTFVSYNVYAMHRRTDIYGPDAEVFRPERWEDGKLQPRWGYLPFNGGPRICIGQRYALTEVGYVLVRMSQEFRVLESRDPGPWEESRGLTVTSKNGTKVGLTAD